MVKYQKLAKSVGRNEGFWIISDIGNFGRINQKYCLDGVVKLVVDFDPLITVNLCALNDWFEGAFFTILEINISF